MKKCLCFQKPLSRVAGKHAQGSSPGHTQGMGNPGVGGAAGKECLLKKDTQIWPVRAPFPSWLSPFSLTLPPSTWSTVALREDCTRKALDHHCPTKLNTSCVCNLRCSSTCVLKAPAKQVILISILHLNAAYQKY